MLDDGRRGGGRRERLHEAAARRVAHEARCARSRAASCVVVGVNAWTETRAVAAHGRRPVDPGGGRIGRARADRVAARVPRAAQRRARCSARCATSTTRSRAGGNVMPPSIRAAHAGVTTGEWADALRKRFGEYRAPTGVGIAARAGAGERRDRAVRERVRALGRALGRPLKMLVGKPGLDGHSNGAEQIAVTARDVGMEVVYEGIRLTPERDRALGARRGRARDRALDPVGLARRAGGRRARPRCARRRSRRAGGRRRHHPRGRRAQAARAPACAASTRRRTSTSRASWARSSTWSRSRALPPERKPACRRAEAALPPELAARLLARDRAAVAEALNLADDRRAGRRAQALALLDALERGDAVPGPPRDRRHRRARRRQVDAARRARARAAARAARRVAIVAVDPSSRAPAARCSATASAMRSRQRDPGVFVRSMAARERLGGISDAARAGVAILAAVFDHVFVETVGVGQSEIRRWPRSSTRWCSSRTPAAATCSSS